MSEEIKPRTLAAECAAEFAGTLILILFGVGVVAQVVAGGIGDHDSIAWAWGLGVTFGVYVAARLSGAHLNPAVTVTLALFRGFSWAKVGPYALAQTLGAFVAALIVRWNYSEVIAALDPDHTIATQGIFSTLPGNGTLPVGIGGAFRDQVIGTAILLFVILAVGDVRSTTPGVNLAPLRHRPHRRRHRLRLGHRRRLRHQPRPRLRPAARLLPHRLRHRLARAGRQPLLLGADRRPRSSAARSGRCCTTR